MAKEIKVDTNQMGKDIDMLKNSLQAIKSGSNMMYDQVRALDASWDGTANQAFNQQFSRDRNDMESICNTIEGVIQSMEYAKKEYETCEAEISAIIEQIKV